MSLANIKDSNDFMDNHASIEDAKSNQWTSGNLSQRFVIDGSVIMDSPSNVLNKFFDILSKETVKVNLEERFFYKPEDFAREMYGSSDLWWIVLQFAGMTSHTEFCVPSINFLPTYRFDLIQELIDASKDEISKITQIEDLTLYPVKI